MKKTIIPILFILTILLGACAASLQETPTPQPDAAVDEPAAVPQEDSASQTEEAQPLTSTENPCVPFRVLDQYLFTPYSGLPPVTEEDWAVGPQDASVTFMVYSDIQCPYCAILEPILVSLQDKYPNDIRLVFRHWPLFSIHDKSMLAAQALEAAGLQGKFSELKNFLFEHLRNDINTSNELFPDEEYWAGIGPDVFDDWLVDRVTDLGIDADQFIKDMYSDEIVNKIQEKKSEADNLGLGGTPALFINGYLWEIEKKSEIFSIFTQLILKQSLEYSSCPADLIDEQKSYTATITTSQGDIEVELFADAAPYAVNSFIFLAREGWYDGLSMLVTENMVLSGDPSDTGYGGPGYVYLDESNPDRSFDQPGMLAVYNRLGPGMNGSVFFITKSSLPEIEGYTIFGEVLEGLDVLEKISTRSSFMDPVIDRVLSVTITEN